MSEEESHQFTKKRFANDDIMPTARTGATPSCKRRIPAPPPTMEAARAVPLSARREHDAIAVEQAHRQAILQHERRQLHSRSTTESQKQKSSEDQGPNKETFSHLNFLSGRPAWSPSSTVPSSRPTTVPLKSSTAADKEETPKKKVRETSPRLLASPKRVELSAKLPLLADKKKVDVGKLNQRMQQQVDVWQAKQKKLEEARKSREGETDGEKKKNAATDENGEEDDSAAAQRARPLTETEERLLHRLIDEPKLKHENEIQKLTKKFCVATHSPRINSPRSSSPPAADGSTSKSGWTTRLYNQGVAKQNEVTQRAVRKYVDEVKPQFAHRTEAERKEYTEKLVKNEPR